MARRLPSGKKNSVLSSENVCSYCLFFQPHGAAKRPLCGNCTHHKEWIENASLTTCSDMSSRHLDERGIYRLLPSSPDGCIYVRRTQRIRTRLFLVKK